MKLLFTRLLFVGALAVGYCLTRAQHFTAGVLVAIFGVILADSIHTEMMQRP